MSREVRIERFELKYIIPYHLMNEIINYIELYCDKDPYSTSLDEGFYTVNSLYLDSTDFELLERKKNKFPNRFNLRVRSYGDGSKPPYFLEMKCKKGEIVDKIRSRVEDEDWSTYFSYNKDLSLLTTTNRDNLIKFFINAMNLQVEPKILTQYERLAYFSTIDDYARVTFDRSLRFQMVDNFTVTPDPQKMNNYDFGSAFGEDKSSIVLELKSHRKVPQWMLDMIRIFGLNKKSFSKYERSLEESLFSDLTDMTTFVPAPFIA
jgi:SPX domain protein involved in polyphosphate accumulation